MALVLTGVARYDTLNNPAPVATAFASLGLPWIALIVSLAAVVGIASVMLAFLMACARIWFAMSRDGLMPEWFAHTHPRFKSPYRPTLIAGALTAVIAAFYPIRDVAELVNIGTLSAFVVICLAVIVLRYAKNDLRARFRTPLMPVTPLLGACFSLWLLSRLPVIAWERFFIWMALGIAIYLLYGRAHSRLNK
jgi:APA family basic amino acid/polyamine antiporter